MPKVICVGFHRTGTTSLYEAFHRLGYRTAGFRHDLLEETLAGDFVSALETAGRHDFLKDWPWTLMYPELDRAFPGSKFILLRRRADHWLRSIKNHAGGRTNKTRELIYGTGLGCPEGNEEHYLKCYESHNQAVLNYFRDRPEDFLELDLESYPDPWQALQGFLGIRVPSAPFPHVNQSREASAAK